MEQANSLKAGINISHVIVKRSRKSDRHLCLFQMKFTPFFSHITVKPENGKF